MQQYELLSRLLVHRPANPHGHWPFLLAHRQQQGQRSQRRSSHYQQAREIHFHTSDKPLNLKRNLASPTTLI